MSKIRNALACLLPLVSISCLRNPPLRLHLQVMQWRIGQANSRPQYVYPEAPLVAGSRVALRAWPAPKAHQSVFLVGQSGVQRLAPQITTSAPSDLEQPMEWPPQPWPSGKEIVDGPADYVLVVASKTPLSPEYCRQNHLPCQAASLPGGDLWAKLNGQPECRFTKSYPFPAAAPTGELTDGRNPRDPKTGQNPPEGGKRPWAELRGDVATFVTLGKDAAAPVQFCVKLCVGNTCGD